MKYKITSKKIRYLYGYVIRGEGISKSALKAGYSASYSNRINSYENWIRILGRIKQVDITDKEYVSVSDEVEVLQEYCREQSKKSKTFN